MKIKKGYIFLFAIGVLWYGIYHYKERAKFLEIEKKTNDFFTLIAHQDIFKIQEYLDANMSRYISLEQILQFCQTLHYTKIKIDSYKEKNRSIEVYGKLFEKKQSFPFYLQLKDGNRTKIKEFRIGNNSLTSYKITFPIVAK